MWVRLLTAVLLNLRKRCALFFLVAWQVLDALSRLNELNGVELAHDLSCVLRFQILLANISRLVVEETVGISLPGHSSEENPNKKRKPVIRSLKLQF